MPAPMLVLAAALTAAPQQAPGYDETVDALFAARPDPTRVRSVTNLVLRRENAEVLLIDGQLALLTPVAGVSPGAVFSGSGLFRLAPPLSVERDHLARVLDDDRLVAGLVEVPMEGAVLLFTDTTLAELGGLEAFGPSTPDGDLMDALDQARSYLTLEHDRDVDPAIMTALLNPARPPIFHVHVKPSDGDPVFFRIDDAAVEEVSFGVKQRRVRGDQFETLTQLHRVTDYREGRVFGEDPRLAASLDHYDIQARIDGGMNFEAVTHVTVTPSADGAAWLPLTLYPELEPDSVWWASGPARISRPGDGPRLWVEVPAEARAGKPLVLGLAYQGDLIDRTQGWVILRSSTGWYPRYGPSPATFDVTFRSPEDHPLAGSGERVSHEVHGDEVVSRWVVDDPAIHASFNLGRFEEEAIRQDGLPPITLHYAEAAHRRLGDQLIQRGVNLLQQEDMGQAVGFDIAQSLRFFQDRFGPLPTTSFHVTEIPASHGQAFPGMIHLSWSTFQWTGQKGFDQMFRAHEVAHQWWGLSVSPDSYHDTWLSEGLSEFSGLWYMGVSQMSPQLYLDRLIEYRDEILDRRGKASPVWLGPRVVTSADRNTGADYQTMVYQKGAWVFHMLRNLLLDLDTLSEDAFNQLLRELYGRHGGGRVSTQEFQALVEERLGDMGWFFRQWVYGTDLPTYRFSYRGEDTADGYRVRVRVEQEDVPDDFRMYVPILVSFGDEGWARMRVLVEGPLTEFELPLMPRAPDEIRFNDLESVLAEVKLEDWR